MKNLKIKLLTGLMGLSTLSLAHAETAIASVETSAEVIAFCNISAENIVFNPFSPNDSTTWSGTAIAEIAPSVNINPVCSKGTSYSLSMDLGAYGVTGNSLGQMTHTINSDAKLGYLLTFTNPMTSTGGTILANTDFITLTGEGIDGSEQLVPILGKIMHNLATYKFRRAIAGSYSDTVTLTVTY